MHRIYKVGILHERIDKNPTETLETRRQSLYKAVVITPQQQTLAILKMLTNPRHYRLVLICAATALRASENELVPDLVFHDRDPKWGFVFFSGRVQ